MTQFSITPEQIRALKDIHKIYLSNNLDREKTITDVIAKYNCESMNATIALDISRALSETLDTDWTNEKSLEIYNIYLSNDSNEKITVDNLLSLNIFANRKKATLALRLSIALHNANID